MAPVNPLWHKHFSSARGRRYATLHCQDLQEAYSVMVITHGCERIRAAAIFYFHGKTIKSIKARLFIFNSNPQVLCWFLSGNNAVC